MEDREGAASLTLVPAPASVADGWIVSPAFDLVFFANLGWPLLLLPGFVGRSETVVDFWQVYFLTLPHRWITLVLVAADPDRRGGRGLALAGIAVAFAIGVIGVWKGTAAFTCLAVVDYVWNSWHFAAQHSGVLRIYGRKVGAGLAGFERHGIRFFVTYVALRTAAWTTGWIDPESQGRPLALIDLATLIVPLVLLIAAALGFRRARTGRTAYLASISLLYGGLLLSLVFQWAPGVIALTTASGLFHAVEYLAIVTHYAHRRREVGSAGMFRKLATVWLPFLAVYGALVGCAGVWFESGANPGFELWQGLNLWAAFVHYAFDGMIWKLRRPETSRALGLGPAVSAV